MTVAINWDKPHLELIWDKVHFGGSVYAFLFSDGTTKVGKSQHLRRRFNDHLSHFRWNKGARLSDFWFSGHHDYYSVTEKQAIKAAESLMTPASSRTGKEYFHHIDFEELLALLQELDPCAPELPPVLVPA